MLLSQSKHLGQSVEKFSCSLGQIYGKAHITSQVLNDIEMIFIIQLPIHLLFYYLRIIQNYHSKYL